MSKITETAVPRDFFCEHAASKSRVVVLLGRQGCYDSLQAVLTCADAGLAQEVAVLLRHTVDGGHEVTAPAEADRVAALLPTAVAASFRQALAWGQAGAWPVPSHAHLVRLADSDHVDDLDSADADVTGRTPSGARLVDLPGTVVRIFRMVELHAHDPQRLRAAAIAAGWPGAETDEHSDDPDDVLDAAMCLTDDLPPLPGADLITIESIGEFLNAATGDEVADWSPTPIEVNFGTGWRLSHRDHAGSASVVPDFASLFPVDGEAASWQLTPRTASALYTALCLLADEAYDDVEAHGDDPVTTRGAGDCAVLDRLPRISWRQSAAWRRDIARAADDLAGDLECGRWPEPRCNAEELLLHLTIEDAEGLADDLGDSERRRDLPEYDDDYDWDTCSEVLFQDHDVLLLDSGWADGVEDPNSDLNQQLGIGDLSPANWFRPFDNAEPRDADRGYRR